MKLKSQIAAGSATVPVAVRGVLASNTSRLFTTKRSEGGHLRRAVANNARGVPAPQFLSFLLSAFYFLLFFPSRMVLRNFARICVYLRNGCTALLGVLRRFKAFLGDRDFSTEHGFPPTCPADRSPYFSISACVISPQIPLNRLKACLKKVAAGFPACRIAGASSPADPALKLENHGKSSVGPGGKMPPSTADRDVRRYDPGAVCFFRHALTFRPFWCLKI
ncbi:MAG: hypothetical protein ACLQSR_13170 [Limisphaerales bacterium]